MVFRDIRASERRAYLPEFHERYGDLPLNAAALALANPGLAGAHALLDDALEYYMALGRGAARENAAGDARHVLAVLPEVMQWLPDSMRQSALETFEQMEPALRSAAGTP